ncbi:homoserine dehydrogenase [Tengunoibacter tsumagoiensis]|uniref:Homoserine dehydrogenase n=1 Tax=Tengunoibacter tsumagoiensis TaxID=2014871 RepID=A0A402A2L5_9CHLR|nr:homoserine dehydrogenase [Tengunoibacter tsumagoiensis]GCE13380.1 homoserine dehydrogenase [Tengunoibacter tsumagoiensis]
MKFYRLCIVGFGNVGQSLLRLLIEKRDELREKYEVEWQVTGVASRRIGWLADPEGLDVAALLRGEWPEQKGQPANVREWLIAARGDVLFELTSLNVETGEPAIEHIRTALELDIHAITANKGTIVHGYHELQSLSRERGKRFLYEATVMAGSPLFSLFQASLPLARLLRFRGLLNSTSNVVLAEIEQGKSFADAIKKAQEIGIAESDPSADVDGWDAAVKVCAIAKVLMEVELPLEAIEVQGIRGLSVDEIQKASLAGRPYKLVAGIERTEGGVKAWVRPEQITPGDPFTTIGPAGLLSHFELDVIPGLTIALHIPNSGTAGPDVTAYDVLADFIRVVQH